MEKKIFGIVGLFFFLISALLYALYAEGVPYNVIGRFLSLPSFVIVVAFSGLSYAKSDNYQFNELGKVLKLGFDTWWMGWNYYRISYSLWRST